MGFESSSPFQYLFGVARVFAVYQYSAAVSMVTPDEKKREPIVRAANSPCHRTRGGNEKSGVGPPQPPPLPRPPPLPLHCGLHSQQRTIIGSKNLDVESFK